MTNLERNYLKHHGILGQKWGVRRYQNEDGTLTEEGKRRYSDNPELYKKDLKKSQEEYDKAAAKNYVESYNRAADYANKVLIPQINEKYKDYDFNDPKNNEAHQKYIEEYTKEFEKIRVNELEKMIGSRPEYKSFNSEDISNKNARRSQNDETNREKRAAIKTAAASAALGPIGAALSYRSNKNEAKSSEEKRNSARTAVGGALLGPVGVGAAYIYNKRKNKNK